MPRSVPDIPLQSKTQRARVLRLLVDAKGSWISLPEILALGIAQFGARILELRRMGFNIENKTERDDFGAIHSWYRLVASPSAPTPKPEPVKPKPAAIPDSSDWFERKHGPRPVAAPPKEDLPLFTGAALTPPEPRP